MKILSYNVYGVKETEEPIPKWDIKQKNMTEEGSDHRPVILTIKDKEEK